MEICNNCAENITDCACGLFEEADIDGYEASFEASPTMTPSEDQQLALDSMLAWLDDGYTNSEGAKTRKFIHKYPFYLLQGYAGTGKSFSITQLAKSGVFKASEICFTAPTNKAVKVLRNYLDAAGLQSSPTKTIYSLLGLSLQANGEVKEIKKPEEPVDLSSYKVIIVDEASMVNSFLFSAIQDAFADWSVPFIFMGDPAQLPPVGEVTSPVWSIPNSSILTKVLRYGNSMLDLATKVRNVVDHPFPSISIDTNPPVHRLRKPDWLAAAFDNLELFQSGEAKIIAWRNIIVDEYNQLIRKKIFGPLAAREPWLPGDKLIAKSPCKDLDDLAILHTAEEAEVLECQIVHHPILSQYEVFQLLVTAEGERKKTLFTLTPQGQREVSTQLAQLQMEAKQPGKGYKWREFWGLKESFHELKHSYALTSHMSQGSSYLKVWVDLEDIMRNRNRQEAFRSLYVSVTRQREELYVS